MRHIDPKYAHIWNLSPREAIAIQKKLAGHVCRCNRLEPVHSIAGVDVGFHGHTAVAAVVVLTWPELKLLESAVASLPVSFPYVPGLLTFREGPVILKAFDRLSRLPDLGIFDGQGIAHPRRLGIAAHIGLLLNLPTIGCAKTRLCGTFSEPGTEKGQYAPLTDREDIIGAAVRTRTHVKPVFVSIGHRIDLETAVHYVLSCCRTYRLPETTRKAHALAAKTA